MHFAKCGCISHLDAAGNGLILSQHIGYFEHGDIWMKASGVLSGIVAEPILQLENIDVVAAEIVFFDSHGWFHRMVSILRTSTP
jgi:hypothetical protein